MSTIQTAQIPAFAAGSRAAAPSAKSRRLVAMLVFIGSSVILGVAAYLSPAPAGVGSHEQLGLPPCGWIGIADMPCPTCGMTTAFAHAADGRVLTALHTQPLGGILALAVAMTWLVSVYVMATGSRLGGAFARLWSAKTAWALSAAVVLAWGYKIASYKGWLP